jgi:hypothetical protein
MYKYVVLVLILICFDLGRINGQCVPASSDNCEAARHPPLCSLNQLNGFTCSTPTFQNPTACLPCNGSGTPNNSQWWAFVAQGGSVTITINYNGCYIPGGGVATGLEFGIVRHCECSGQVLCNKTCAGSSGTMSSTVSLVACGLYYLWIDGCNGDVCNYTINISGNGASPSLSPLSTISQAIASPICKGCCSDFWVEPQPGTCVPNYKWTLDGVEISGNYNRSNFCFADEGTFQVCVFAYTGSESNICMQTPTRCTTAVVMKKQEQRAKSKLICSDLIPYRWHCENVYISGTYRCPFKLNGCCEYDSVIDITFIEKIDGPEIYFIGCPGEQYVDPITKIPYTTCNNRKEINLPKATRPFGCDSSYFLSSIYPSSTGKISLDCKSGGLFYNASVWPSTKLCGNLVDLGEGYEWYEKTNPQNILSTDNILTVSKEGSYCVRHLLNYKLGDVTKTCRFEYCEEFDEDKYLKIGEIQGEEISQNGSIEFYKVDFLDSIMNKYIWRVEGGVILDSFPERLDSINVKWNSTTDTIGKVCLRIENECISSNEICKLVMLKQVTDRDEYLSSKVRIIPNPNDGNFSVTFDEDVNISKISLFDEEGKEVKVEYKLKESYKYQIAIKSKIQGLCFLKLQTNKGMLYKKIIFKD